jgi:hypothetical protein
MDSPSSRELPRPPRGRSESPLLTHTASPVLEPTDGAPRIAYLDSPPFRSMSGSPALGTPTRVASPFSRGLESMPSMGSLNDRGLGKTLICIAWYIIDIHGDYHKVARFANPSRASRTNMMKSEPTAWPYGSDDLQTEGRDVHHRSTPSQVLPE